MAVFLEGGSIFGKTQFQDIYFEYDRTATGQKVLDGWKNETGRSKKDH